MKTGLGNTTENMAPLQYRYLNVTKQNSPFLFLPTLTRLFKAMLSAEAACPFYPSARKNGLGGEGSQSALRVSGGTVEVSFVPLCAIPGAQDYLFESG